MLERDLEISTVVDTLTSAMDESLERDLEISTVVDQVTDGEVTEDSKETSKFLLL